MLVAIFDKTKNVSGCKRSYESYKEHVQVIFYSPKWKKNNFFRTFITV